MSWDTVMTLARILLWPLRPVLMLIGFMLAIAGIGNLMAHEWVSGAIFCVMAGCCWEGRRALLP
jgi:hypothetical protein